MMKYNLLTASLILLLFSCGSPQKNDSLNNSDTELARAILADKTLDKVEKMGKELLSKGYNAGSGYSEVWIRDMNTFIETSLEVVEPSDVKKALSYFLLLQQPNDEIIDGYVLKGRVDWYDPNQYYSDNDPDHVGFKNTVETDQETSLVQAVRKYVEKTGDIDFLSEDMAGKTVYQRLKAAMEYLLREKYDSKYGLLTGALTSDWGDVENDPENCVDIGPGSIVTIDIYDNAMMVIALRDLQALTGDPAEKAYWKGLGESFSRNIRKYLWDKKNQRFIPHIYPDGKPEAVNFDEDMIYYHGGTAIAIEAGLLTKEEIAKVNSDMLENVKASGMPSIGLTVYPPYPYGFFPGFYPGGMANPYSYQNGGDWTWFGGRMIQQLVGNGFVQEAYQEIRPMIDRVIVNGDFYEWYGPGGVPSGSAAFKGSAGVLCKAIRLLRAWAMEHSEGEVENLSQYVNPLIGSAHCRWFHVAPGALPFGLAKPGPSTNGSYGNKSGWEATGYDYRHTSIEGFPCLHEFQVGGIVLMPTTGVLKTIPGTLDGAVDGYRSAFSHENETAAPGYYSVWLDDYGIKAEVTATKRVAYQRFNFPGGEEGHLLFDIGNRQGESGPAKDAEVVIREDGTVEGWVRTLPVYSDKYQDGATVTMFFSADLDKKPSESGTFVGKKVFSGAKSAKGVGAGAYLSFPAGTGTVTARVGLSYTSIENARLNRESETEGGKLGFDEARTRSALTWESYLGRIRVKTASVEDKVKFYTGLYHAVLGRGLASDVNGDYPTHDGGIGHLPKGPDGGPAFSFVNSDGIWGGQWNLTQVWALAYPEYLSDFVNTHIQVYKDSGWLGDGIACSRYVSGVGTNQLGNTIAAAYMRGIRTFDVEAGYAAARKNELDGENRPMGAGKMDTDQFVRLGYVPHKDSGPWPDEGWMFSASHTLEYCFGAYAVAQMARELGKTEDYDRLMELSKGWENIYDDKENLIHPKWENGEFIGDFNPMQVWRGFQEGNAYQYTFYVPHDPKSLIAKMGAEEFSARLDSIFARSEANIFSGGKTIDAFAGLQTYYNQGNQPCLHIPWLFNQAGRPSLTQKWVRAILDDFYGTDGIHGYGYGQDEDQGQLGAWYVISSLGLFDVAGLCDKDAAFALGSPKFDEVTITLDERYYPGGTFTIVTRDNSRINKYAQSYVLNGQELHTPFIPFDKVVSGGRLEVGMGMSPKDSY